MVNTGDWSAVGTGTPWRGPIRIVQQLAATGVGTPTETFVGVLRGVFSTLNLINSNNVNAFGVGIDGNVGTNNWAVLANGATTDTGVAGANSAIIAELVENPSLTWTVTLYDAVTLAVVYGPTAFPAQPAGDYNFVCYAQNSGSNPVEFSGVVVGPAF